MTTHPTSFMEALKPTVAPSIDDTTSETPQEYPPGWVAIQARDWRHPNRLTYTINNITFTPQQQTNTQPLSIFDDTHSNTSEDELTPTETFKQVLKALNKNHRRHRDRYIHEYGLDNYIHTYLCPYYDYNYFNRSPEDNEYLYHQEQKEKTRRQYISRPYQVEHLPRNQAYYQPRYNSSSSQSHETAATNIDSDNNDDTVIYQSYKKHHWYT